MISNRSIKGKLEMFCVFYVDMEDSTYNTSFLRPEDYFVYYAAFYDTLTDVARKFGDRVIKHVGDALIIYFPATSDPSNREAFKSTLDCANAMLEDQCSISTAFEQESLPPVNYRISADYGRMEPIETPSSPTIDWIGPSMNMVAKMNRLARSNSMVLGGDLYQVLSRFSFQEYLFYFAGELSIGIKQKYPVYSATRNKSNNSSLNVSGNTTATTVVAHPMFRLGKKGGLGEEKRCGYKEPNVLIVDDENDILLVYKQYLSGQPVNVEVFSDPLQLLGRIAEVGPSYYDLAIIDVRMPKISGFQLYQILTSLKPSIKTLFVSALDYAVDVLAGLRGIDKEEDFIKKPVNREAFLCAVNRKISLYA